MVKISSFIPVVISFILSVNCNKTVSPENSNLITHTLRAIVVSDHEIIFGDFKAKLGDTLTGSISYLLNSHDNNDGDFNQGWYYDLPFPAKLSFTLNNLQYSSNAMFIIGIQNNDTQPSQKGDIFDLYSHDTAAADRFNADDVQANLKLQDTTSTVFPNDSLPSEINPDNFAFKWLSVSFVKNDTVYDVSLRITNISKEN